MWTQNSVSAAHLKSETFLWFRHYSASIFNVSISTITSVQIEIIIKKLSYLLKKMIYNIKHIPAVHCRYGWWGSRGRESCKSPKQSISMPCLTCSFTCLCSLFWVSPAGCGSLWAPGSFRRINHGQLQHLGQWVLRCTLLFPSGRHNIQP